MIRKKTPRLSQKEVSQSLQKSQRIILTGLIGFKAINGDKATAKSVGVVFKSKKYLFGDFQVINEYQIVIKATPRVASVETDPQKILQSFSY